MKQTDLLKRVRRQCRTVDLSLDMVREGGNHTIYRVGTVIVTMPRHREISIGVSNQIMKDLEEVLGEGWWK